MHQEDDNILDPEDGIELRNGLQRKPPEEEEDGNDVEHQEDKGSDEGGEAE